MKFRIGIAVGLIGVGLSAGAQTGDFVIASFGGNGGLTWTGVPVGTTCRVEWASSLTSGWHDTWANLTGIVATNESTTVQVPMFYRVVCALDLNGGMLAHYRLDGSGEDSTTNANHGTLSGVEATSNRLGVAGTACDFNGNDYIRVPDAPALNITGAVSIAVWLKASSVSGTTMILGKSDYLTTTDYILRIKPGGGIQWEYNRYYETGAGVLEADKWYHLVVTAESRELGTRRTIYVNGTSVPYTSYTGQAGQQGKVSNPFTIGAAWYWSAPGSEHFQGALDDVRIYDHELSPVEVKALFNAENP